MRIVCSVDVCVCFDAQANTEPTHTYRFSNSTMMMTAKTRLCFRPAQRIISHCGHTRSHREPESGLGYNQTRSSFVMQSHAAHNAADCYCTRRTWHSNCERVGRATSNTMSLIIIIVTVAMKDMRSEPTRSLHSHDRRATWSHALLTIAIALHCEISRCQNTCASEAIALHPVHSVWPYVASTEAFVVVVVVVVVAEEISHRCCWVRIYWPRVRSRLCWWSLMLCCCCWWCCFCSGNIANKLNPMCVVWAKLIAACVCVATTKQNGVWRWW